jgi:mannitol/fructose-specific phosphotransferase system IIA component (Ntr-type)
MKFSDFVAPRAIIADLQATNKEGVICEIVGRLHSAGCLAEADLEVVTRAILGREELGSTGFGGGLALPEGCTERVAGIIGTVAISRHEIDFDALDEEPVDLVFLLLFPPRDIGQVREARRTIDSHLKDERFVNDLRQARTPEQVLEVLWRADRQAPDGPSGGC